MGKKRTVNKTLEIKNVLSETPGASPKEISEALKEKGIEATPGYVSTIKSGLKRKPATRKKKARKKLVVKRAAKKAAATKKVRRKKKRRKVGKRARVAAAATGASASTSLSALRQAKALADKLGGIDKAKQVLDALNSLQ